MLKRTPSPGNELGLRLARRLARVAAALGCTALLALVAIPAQSVQHGHGSANASAQNAAPDSHPKADAQAAKDAYKRGIDAVQKQDWQAAYEQFADAVNLAPQDRQYFTHREIAKGEVVNEDVNLAERDALAGKLNQARRELLNARYLAPQDDAIRERIEELRGMEPPPDRQSPADEDDLGPQVELDPQPGTRNFNYQGDSEGAYKEIARQFGVEAEFDTALRPRRVQFRVDGLDFQGAMRMLGDMTGTFWVPLAKRLFFVAEDTAVNRRQYEPVVMRRIVLPAAYSTNDVAEIFRAVREMTGITSAQLEERSHTITVRAPARQAALAADLVGNLDKPPGEVMLEIEVLEVDRNSARQFGIVPPQTATLYSLSPQEAQEAQQSYQGLVNVISQVFGLPSSLSGLSPTQIGSLVGSGEAGLGSLLPPLVAFGGGQSLFLATLPGATANFAEMLSTVKSGRRIMLRAQDDKPTTFFVGERVPFALTQIANSAGGPGSFNVNPSSFPTAEYPVGQGPVFVTAASLRDTGVQDLIAANFTDNTLSILPANGDGTFGAQTTVPTGSGPAWIATGNFNAATNTKDTDLAVANENASSVSIFIANNDSTATPDGTFTAGQVLTTGTKPVSVVAANFRNTTAAGVLDLAVANQGDNSISIFQGNNDGTFQTTPAVLQLPNGYAPAALAVGDFNNDGHPDLVVADEGSNTVSIFPGKGDGTFSPRTDYQVGNGPAWVSVADLNGDGVLDLAVADSGAPTTDSSGNPISGDSVSVLLGNSDGTFQSHVDYAAGTTPMSIAVADFNIDGLPDLAVADQADNAVSLLPGIGSGQFGANLELNVGNSPVGIVTADFNGDGLPDAAIANNASDNLSVILNSSTLASGIVQTAVNGQSGQNGQIFPGAQFFDIGLKIKATPRIHPDNEVSLDLDFDISSLSSQNFNGIPVVNEEKVTQMVRVKAGEATALAGILQPQVTNAINGTPGLASIPGIGLLGKDRNTQSQDTELLILVTPHIVRFTPRENHIVYAGQGAPLAPTFLPEIPRELQERGRATPGELQRAPGPQPPSRPIEPPHNQR